MAKRFTDTEKYKKPFVRGLKGPYKLLWDYLYHDCDNAGIWIVDFEIAQIYLGADMKVNEADALKFFNADQYRIHAFDGGKKWFIPSFISFQYNELSETNPAHKKILTTLLALNFLDENKGPSKDLQSTFQGTKVMDKVVVDGMDEDKELDKVKEKKGTDEKKKFADMIPESWRGVGFNDLWSDYRQMRTKIRKPLTDRGEKESLKDLIRLSGGDWFKAEIIAINSIKNSWQGFFQIKDNGLSNVNKPNEEFVYDTL